MIHVCLKLKSPPGCEAFETTLRVKSSISFDELLVKVSNAFSKQQMLPSSDIVLAGLVGGELSQVTVVPNCDTELSVFTKESWELHVRRAKVKTVACGKYLTARGGSLVAKDTKVQWEETMYRHGADGMVVADRFMKGNLDWVRLLFDNSVPLLQILLYNLRKDSRTTSRILLKKQQGGYGQGNKPREFEDVTLEEFFAHPSRFDFGVLLTQIKFACKSWSGPKGVVVKASNHGVYVDVDNKLKLSDVIAKAFKRNFVPDWAISKNIESFVTDLRRGENVSLEYICDVLLTFARLFMAHQVYLDPEVADLVRSEHIVRMYFAMILDCCDGLERHVKFEKANFGLHLKQIRGVMADFNEFADFGHRFRGPSYSKTPSRDDALRVLDDLRASVEADDDATIQHVVHLGHRLVARVPEPKTTIEKTVAAPKNTVQQRDGDWRKNSAYKFSKSKQKEDPHAGSNTTRRAPKPSRPSNGCLYGGNCGPKSSCSACSRSESSNNNNNE